jgi:hypothetical protein
MKTTDPARLNRVYRLRDLPQFVGLRRTVIAGMIKSDDFPKEGRVNEKVSPSACDTGAECNDGVRNDPHYCSEIQNRKVLLWLVSSQPGGAAAMTERELNLCKPMGGFHAQT